MYSVAVIIISDRAFNGEREDECIPIFKRILPDKKYTLIPVIINDDPDLIFSTLQRFVDENINLIFTSGGTGCSPRDVTPEATKKIIEKSTPGIDEAIRSFSKSKSPFAIYSRAISGVAKNSLIINLPGSPKAVEEILTYLLDTIEHPLQLISESISDCKEDFNK